MSPSALSIQAVCGWRFGSSAAACQQCAPPISMPAFPPLLGRAMCGHWGDCSSWNPRVLLNVRPSSYIFLQTKNHPWRIKGNRYFLLLGLQTLEMLLLHPHRITANGCLSTGSEMPSLWSASIDIVKCPRIKATVGHNHNFRPNAWELGADPSVKDFQCSGTGNGP